MSQRQTPNTWIQFIRFAGVGVVGTLGHYLTLLILVEIAGLDAVISSGTGFTVGAIINYYLNRSFTFQSSTPHRVGLPKFLAVALAGLGLNMVVMAAIVSGFAVHYFVAQIVATGIVLLWNFFANRAWTFRMQPS